MAPDDTVQIPTTIHAPAPNPDGHDRALTVVQRIGRYIADSPRTHAAPARIHARRALLDTVGCMMLGADQPATQQAFATVRDWGSGPAVVFGHTDRLAAPWAAFVNGTSAHALDFDDWEDPGITHASACILPALLALAVPETTIEALEDAWLCGLDVIMRLGEAVNMAHYELGWHSTGTLGPMGTAAACARLMALDAERAAHAVGLSTSMAGGFTAQFGTTAKPVHAGLAAKSGVLAAGLAAQGASAHSAVFEAEGGFLKTMTQAHAEELHACLDKLWSGPAVLEHGVHNKKYPSCGCTHLIIEAAETHAARPEIIPTEIVRMEASISEIALSILPYGVPDTRAEALFSVPWCAAAAMIDGTVRIDSFDAASLQRDDLRALAARTQVTAHPQSPGLAFHPDFPDVLTVEMRDGTRLSEAIAYPIGSPQRPLPDAELVRKFLDCTQGRLPQAEAQALSDALLDLSRPLQVQDVTDAVCAAAA